MSREDFNLNRLQSLAYDAIMNGKNVFITGPAGTGKSYLLDCILKSMKDTEIGITSTTGVSALLIRGTTLHSYLGIKLGKGTVDEILSDVKKNRKAFKRWQETEVLFIDEISMLNPTLFLKLNELGKKIRGNSNLFGGLQLIVSGDFLQLPYIADEDDDAKVQFLHELKEWEQMFECFYFDEVMRQKDAEMRESLSEIRLAQLSAKTIDFLKSRENAEIKTVNGIEPTIIYGKNVNVDYLNQLELDKFAEKDAEFYQYEKSFTFSGFVNTLDKQRIKEQWNKHCLAPDLLELCVGCQVMLLYNIDIPAGLVNGSKGIVTGFTENSNFPIVKFANGIERAIGFQNWDIVQKKEKILSILQIPLKLAWAVTCHKIQGATLDYAIVYLDSDNIFSYGQAYVALSRVKTKEGLSIKKLDISVIKAEPSCLAYYKKLEKEKGKRENKVI